MKNKGLILGVVAFVLFIGVASLLYSKLSQDNTPDELYTYNEKEGEISNNDEGEDKGEAESDMSEYMAPDITVYDADGNAVKLSDLRGKPVVLNFWASWCPPCKREMPAFNDKYLEYKDKIAFMMVNLTDGYQETVSSAKKFLESTDYEFPVYFDSDLNGAYTYGISSVPQTFFIDADGILITGVTGSLSETVLQKGIDYIYSE